ncbi:hypothetical protein VNO80_24218 [Phaseolus coccineus]|uniref:Proline-rich protein n=1 Tax=Phaseolus coccineus TaxID=3886 RepID=A0AAN9LSD8_PHACN
MQVLTRRQGALLCFLSVLFLVAGFCYGHHSTVEVVGLGECTDCNHKNIKTSDAFSGLRVTVDCKAASGDFVRRGVGELDENGNFKVSLPHDIVEADELKEECYAQLLSASAAPCPSHDGPFSTRIVIKSKGVDKHTLRPAGKLKFSSETCASAFFWHHPLLPKLPPHPPITIPPIVFPPLPPKIFHKHPPPVYSPPPVYTPPPVHEEPSPPPSPPKESPPKPPKPSPPKEPPHPKPPKPCPPKEPPHPKPPKPCPPKEPPHPKPPKPSPPKEPPHPKPPKPCPPKEPPHPKPPKPSPPKEPPHPKPPKPCPPKHPLLPPLKPHPHPPLPPLKPHPLPPLKPLPPLPKIPPKHFFHHPKWPPVPPSSSHP